MRYLAILLIVVGCTNSNVPCIRPPETKAKSDKKVLVDIGAKLQKLPIDANLKTEFTKTAETTYDKLSDTNAGLLLLLRALACYLHEADTPEKVELIKPLMAELTQTVRAMWASKNGQRGVGSRLSLKERDLISGSEDSDAILAELLKRGIQ